VRALLAAVSASFDPLVLPKLRDRVYCAFTDRPLAERRDSPSCSAL
jgi:hypothetical protein